MDSPGIQVERFEWVEFELDCNGNPVRVYAGVSRLRAYRNRIEWIFEDYGDAGPAMRRHAQLEFRLWIGEDADRAIAEYPELAAYFEPIAERLSAISA